MASVQALDLINIGPLGGPSETGIETNAQYDAQNGYSGAVLAVGAVTGTISYYGSISQAVTALVNYTKNYVSAWKNYKSLQPMVGISFNNSEASSTAGTNAATIINDWLAQVVSSISPLGPVWDVEYGANFSDYTDTMNMLTAYKAGSSVTPFFDGTGNWTCSENLALFDYFGAAQMFPQCYCVNGDLTEWQGGCGGTPAGVTVTSDSGLSGCTITTAQSGINAYKSVFGGCPTMVLVYLGSSGSPQVSASSLSC